MLFNENEMRQIAKLRMEDTERKARDSWKLADFERETFLQKLIKKWSNHKKPIMVQRNGGCACQCG